MDSKQYLAIGEIEIIVSLHRKGIFAQAPEVDNAVLTSSLL